MPVESQLVQITRLDKLAENDFYSLFPALNKIKLQNLIEPQVPIENLPTKLADNIITPSDSPIPDCMTCGACCAFLLCVAVKPTDSTSDSYVWKITGEDNLGEMIVDKFMRRKAETMTCVALGGNVGETVGCQIYEERPQVCREFEAGSDKCHALRRSYGIELPLTDQRALEAQFRLELLTSSINAAEKLLYAKIAAHPETDDLIIVGVMEDESRKVIHLYNPQAETWLQSEFAGLTLIEAFRLIQSRKAKRQDD